MFAKTFSTYSVLIFHYMDNVVGLLHSSLEWSYKTFIKTSILDLKFTDIHSGRSCLDKNGVHVSQWAKILKKAKEWNVQNSPSFIQNGTELIRFTKMNMGKQLQLQRNGYLLYLPVTNKKSWSPHRMQLTVLVSISKFKIALKNAWHSCLNLNERLL